jgi:trimeric autotransporter adhesin
VSIGAIGSAASYDASAVSPGEIVVLFGSGFGPATLTEGAYANGRLTASIGQTTVRFDGTPAPLIYASDAQIAAIVPYGINATQTTAVVTGPAGTSLPKIMPLAPSVPGLFTADASGSGQLAALNPDGSLNAADNPAKPGDPIVLFGTREGQTSPSGVDGLIMETLATPLLTPAVTVGGQTAPIDYFGSAPQEVAGVFQLNLQIPLNAPTGNAVPIILKVGNASTSKNTTIAIR